MYARHTPSLEWKQEIAACWVYTSFSSVRLGMRRSGSLGDFLSQCSERHICYFHQESWAQFISSWHKDVCHDLQGPDALENSSSLCMELRFGTVKKQMMQSFIFHFICLLQFRFQHPSELSLTTPSCWQALGSVGKSSTACGIQITLTLGISILPETLPTKR